MSKDAHQPPQPNGPNEPSQPSEPKKRRRFNIYIPALGSMIIIIAVIAWIQSVSTVSPDPQDLVNRCSSCHEMTQQVESWQHGSHKDVSCTACHAEPGLTGWAHEQIASIKMKLSSNEGKQPDDISATVPDQRCLDCHARQMPYVMQDIFPPAKDAKLPVPVSQLKPMPATVGHDLHLAGEPQMRCTDCHSETSHGPTLGTQEHKEAFHGRCTDCHESKQVVLKTTAAAADTNTDVSCGACHQDLSKITPASHKSGWREQHGKSSLTENNCGQCHLSGSAGPHGTLTKTADYQQQNNQDACVTCHGGVQMPHPKDWLTQHNSEFKSGAAVCAKCHGVPAGSDFKATFTGDPKTIVNSPACQNCHQVPLPHPQGFLSQHGAQALKVGTATCVSCHSPNNKTGTNAKYASADFCTSCHAGQAMPHASNFLSQHGQAAQTAAPGTCESCHSSKNKANPGSKTASNSFCINCHAGQTMPHPAGFQSNHGTEALKTGANCQACHSSSNPVNPRAPYASNSFCAACHDTYKHPQGWVAAHGTKVDKTCATCHSLNGPATQKNACATCHDSKDKTTGKWHPEYWFVTHGKAALAQGKESCQQCHAEVKPSCTQCHRNP